jgi:hypothetical protein
MHISLLSLRYKIGRMVVKVVGLSVQSDRAWPTTCFHKRVSNVNMLHITHHSKAVLIKFTGLQVRKYRLSGSVNSVQAMYSQPVLPKLVMNDGGNLYFSTFQRHQQNSISLISQPDTILSLCRFNIILSLFMKYGRQGFQNIFLRKLCDY